jgi:uncharacterized protein
MQGRRLPIRTLAVAGLAVAAMLIAGSVTALPHVLADAPTRTVSVSGQGIVTAQPDTVILQIGVSVEARTVAAARGQAAAAADAVIAAVKADGVADQDIKTVQFNIGPRYDNNNGLSVLRGYSVSNVLQVKIRNLDSVGKVIDDATAAGGDAIVVQGISFTIENTDPLTHQARLLAIQDAMTKANDYATAAGATVGPVISISEQSSATPTPVLAAPAPAAAASAARTPVEGGTQQVRVQVSVVFQLQ